VRFAHSLLVRRSSRTLELVETLVLHPEVLIATAIILAPILFPLARFFFEDLETFKAEAGLDYEHDRLMWLLGWPRLDLRLQFKVVGFLGSYCGLVFLAYLSVCRIFF